jgi:DNA repair protein RadC
LSLEVEIEKKVSNIEYEKQVTKPEDVFNINEVQEIKDAIREHLLFIGLDRKNNIRNIRLLGIGSSGEVTIDSKYIVRTALMTASDKVILVHNHPSNNLMPSNSDKHITNVTSKMLEAFHIEFLDHIIVTEKEFISMQKIKSIDKEYEDDKLKLLDKGLLLEENLQLKDKIKVLNRKLQERELEDEDELE